VLKRTAAGDSKGGIAGEDELGRVVGAIRRHLRGSDLIVRLDSDELLCVMFGATAQDASARFGSVRAELEAQPDPRRISVGLTALAPGDSLDELIRSANAAD
jgi:PleD family two-component response regulator